MHHEFRWIIFIPSLFTYIHVISLSIPFVYFQIYSASDHYRLWSVPFSALSCLHLTLHHIPYPWVWSNVKDYCYHKSPRLGEDVCSTSILCSDANVANLFVLLNVFVLLEVTYGWCIWLNPILTWLKTLCLST